MSFYADQEKRWRRIFWLMMVALALNVIAVILNVTAMILRHKG